MIKPKILVFLLLIGTSYNSFAQPGIAHEIGIIAGRIEFRSDYGQRDNTKNNLSNQGFGISVVHYMNFSTYDRFDNYFNEHFKVRSEITYNQADLKHYGEWIEKKSLFSQQLKEMRGSTQLLDLGFQLEYNFKHIHDFENTIGSLNPYIAFGPHFSYYTATATSTLGPMEENVPPKYLEPSDGHPHGYSNESKAVFSLSLNLGTRYKLTTMSDLILDMRAQYYSSDWVDGLNPNENKYKENKRNDWLTFVGLGYIYYLE